MTTPSRPNLLFIHVDQQRYDCLGFTGSSQVSTPHLDALAARGVSFSHAFTPIPLCCPARQTLLSGVMPSVHGGHWNYDSARIKGLKPGEFPTWPEALRDLGYRSAYIGKWHVDPKADPTAFGYEFYHPGFGYDRDRLELRYSNAPVFSTGTIDTRPVAETNTHRMAEMAEGKLREFAANGGPWHLRLDYSEPHLPCFPCRDFAERYRPEDIPPWGNFPDPFDDKPYIQRQQLRNWKLADWTWDQWSVYLAGYFGIISQIDDALGRMLDSLERDGLLENTLIVYTADHGDAAGSHGMIDKHYVMYEEEVRVPLVLRWDKVIPPGRVCDDFVSNCLDLPPTLYELFGLAVPDCCQGVSLLPQLRGEAGSAREHIFSEYNGQQFGLYTQRMIRDRRFKYVWNATDVDELYDLQTDPSERHNLAVRPEYREHSRRYRRMVYDTFTALEDRILANPWMKHQLTELAEPSAQSTGHPADAGADPRPE